MPLLVSGDGLLGGLDHGHNALQGGCALEEVVLQRLGCGRAHINLHLKTLAEKILQNE